VWVDADGAAVTDAPSLVNLELGYDKHRDTNLRFDRWSTADALHPVHDWKGLCGKARTAALAALWDEPTDRARAEAARRFEANAAGHRIVWRSRIVRMPTGPSRTAEEEAAAYAEALDARLLAGIRKPHVRVDAAGAIYISGTNLRAP
jgi:hypothetical protein